MRVNIVGTLGIVAFVIFSILAVFAAFETSACQEAAKAECVMKKYIPSECKAHRENQCGPEDSVVYVY